ncbi:MAG: DNA-directed RNA polymerase subunit beta, partial [Thermovirgaceae bacterium]
MAEFVPVNSKRQRLTFGRTRDLVEIPDLVEIQRDSFRWFFQYNEKGRLIEADERSSQGLQELFDEVFPIESYDGSFALEFVDYFVEDPQITQEEAIQRDLSWSRSVKATIRLVNRKTEEIKEEEVYLGDFPMMTERGTFI